MFVVFIPLPGSRCQVFHFVDCAFFQEERGLSLRERLVDRSARYVIKVKIARW